MKLFPCKECKVMPALGIDKDKLFPYYYACSQDIHGHGNTQNHKHVVDAATEWNLHYGVEVDE